MKAGQALAAASDGTMEVLVKDKKGVLVKDHGEVHVKLTLKLVMTDDSPGQALHLSQAGSAGDHVTATVEEGVAVFTDIIVTGKHKQAALHSLGQVPVFDGKAVHHVCNVIYSCCLCCATWLRSPPGGKLLTQELTKQHQVSRWQVVSAS